MSVTLDATTGAWKWTNPATGMVYYYDSHRMLWKYLQPGTTDSWRWMLTGMKTSAPTPAPAGSPAPTPPPALAAASAAPAAPTPAPAPATAAPAAAAAPTPPTPPAPPAAPRRRLISTRLALELGAAASIVAAIFLMWPKSTVDTTGKPAVTQTEKKPTDGGYSRDDIAGVATAETKKLVEPLTKRIDGVETKVASFETRFKGLEENNTVVIGKLDEISKKLNSTTVPPVSDNSLGKQRLAQIETDCNPGDAAGRDLAKMTQEQFENYLAYCKDAKSKQQVAGAPAPATPAGEDEPDETVKSDEDEDTARPMPGFNRQVAGGAVHAGGMLMTKPVSYRGPRGGARTRYDARDMEDLARIANKTFGPPPTAHHKFDGVRQRVTPAPRNCVQRAVRVPGGTMVRVVCGSAAQRW